MVRELSESWSNMAQAKKSGHLDEPVFVRGLSRSGGTLVATILDATDEISMSYEIYPDLLTADASIPTSATELNSKPQHKPAISPWLVAELLAFGRKPSLELLDKLKMKKLKQFLLRAERSGLNFDDIATALSSIEVSSEDSASLRLACVGAIAQMKARKESKARWGAKCSGQFAMYAKRWPSAKFINIIRDPRDVLASQLSTGNFHPSPSEVGRAWLSNHSNFRKLCSRGRIEGIEVSYESLCLETESTLETIGSFLGVKSISRMKSHSSRNLSIFHKPNGHLSFERIKQPIDASQVGRWKHELQADQLTELYGQIGADMTEFGNFEGD